MSAIDIILIVAGVGYIMTRRLIGELLEAKAVLMVPVVLSVVGLFMVRKADPANGTTIALIAGGCLLSVIIGLVRGVTVHLGERDGMLWMRYRAVTLLLWLLNVVLKGALVPVERSISPASADAANHGILLAIGLGILAETLVVLVRAMKTDSTVVWEKGEDGQPHRSSPAFEQARNWVKTRESSGTSWPWGERDW